MPERSPVEQPQSPLEHEQLELAVNGVEALWQVLGTAETPSDVLVDVFIRDKHKPGTRGYDFAVTNAATWLRTLDSVDKRLRHEQAIASLMHQLQP